MAKKINPKSPTAQYDHVLIRKAMKATGTANDFKKEAVQKVLKEMGIKETPGIIRSMRGRMVFIAKIEDKN